MNANKEQLQADLLAYMDMAVRRPSMAFGGGSFAEAVAFVEGFHLATKVLDGFSEYLDERFQTRPSSRVFGVRILQDIGHEPDRVDNERAIERLRDLLRDFFASKSKGAEEEGA
jgi:hypothetical protein